MSDDPDLKGAYALDGPDANRALYARWAETYDTDFAAENRYLSPGHVARTYAGAGGEGPVLDLGAGTGLVAEALKSQKVAFVPGRAFFADGSNGNTLRLSFSQADEATIEEGIRRLGQLLESYS